MKPVDFRNANFAALRDGMARQRLRVYRAWQAHGPATTSELARESGISILSLRPRTTELLELGLLRVARVKDREGVYTVTSEAEWEDFRFEKIEQAYTQQELCESKDDPFGDDHYPPA